MAYILNQIIEPKYIEPILNLCESMKEFCSKNSILWQIQINQFSPEQSKAPLYNIAIKRERSIVEEIFSQEIQFNDDIKADLTSCLEEAQKKIDELIINDEKDEKLRRMKEKLHENKNKLNNEKPTDNKILILKNQLSAYISQYSENMQIILTEEIINDITEKVNRFIELAKHTKVVKEENHIDWPDCLVKK